METKTKKTESKGPDIYDALFEIQKKQLVVKQTRQMKLKEEVIMYANLDDTLEVALPVLITHQILYTAYTENAQIISRFMHVPSGTCVTASLDIGNPTSNVELAARISVAKRYHLRSVLNIRGEDVIVVPEKKVKVSTPALKEIVQDLTVELDENEPFSEALQNALKYVEASSNKDVLAMTKSQVEKSEKLSDIEKAYVLKKIDGKIHAL